MSRDRIDEVRRLLVDAFLAEDTTTYSNAVLELEQLIGVGHGDRNPKDTSACKTLDQRTKGAARARQFRWGNRSIEAELYDDGGLTYSIKYGDEP